MRKYLEIFAAWPFVSEATKGGTYVAKAGGMEKTLRLEHIPASVAPRVSAPVIDRALVPVFALPISFIIALALTLWAGM